MRIRTAVAAAALLTVVGCSQAPDHRASMPLPVPLNGAAQPAPDEERVLHEAEERAVASCMRDKGFGYRRVPPVPAPGANPYGLLTREEAEDDGYGMTSAALAAPGPDPNVRLTEGWSTERRKGWERALVGTSRHERTITARHAPSLRVNTNGCVYQSQIELYGRGWEEARLALEGVNAKLLDDVTSTKAYAKGQRAWARCMRSRGEPYSTLDDARGAIQQQLAGAGTTPEALRRVARKELDLAVGDAQCQDESKLADIIRTGQRRAEKQLPDSAHRLAERVSAARQRVVADTPAGTATPRNTAADGPT
ncbi:hypothetical protein AB0B50_21035 [Streptomyces sp. NPDC041068]|uniref:hypothetical protein n=1 Tax=Streptomyces sp. NPDC041068 TaxID=3155130 RepID=UPI0033CD5279